MSGIWGGRGWVIVPPPPGAGSGAGVADGSSGRGGTGAGPKPGSGSDGTGGGVPVKTGGGWGCGWGWGANDTGAGVVVGVLAGAVAAIVVLVRTGPADAGWLERALGAAAELPASVDGGVGPAASVSWGSGTRTSGNATVTAGLVVAVEDGRLGAAWGRERTSRDSGRLLRTSRTTRIRAARPSA